MYTEPLQRGILTLLGAEGDERERRRRAKPAEFRAVSVEMREPELAGRERNYIGATRTETKEKERGVHLAPLTPLIMRAVA